MSISLTDFVDFVAKSGTPRLTHVRQIKDRGEYDPAEDFWRKLRNGIVEFHRAGHAEKGSLDSLGNQQHAAKADNYPVAIKGYKKFLGRKSIKWFEPPAAHWREGGLDIRVNPELGLIINGQRHILKLYFKGTPLTKNKADMILLLMSASLLGASEGDVFSILDVRRAKLFMAANPSAEFMPLLKAEAVAFQTIWDGI